MDFSLKLDQITCSELVALQEKIKGEPTVAVQEEATTSAALLALQVLVSLFQRVSEQEMQSLMHSVLLQYVHKDQLHPTEYEHTSLALNKRNILQAASLCQELVFKNYGTGNVKGNSKDFSSLPTPVSANRNKLRAFNSARKQFNRRKAGLTIPVNEGEFKDVLLHEVRSPKECKAQPS